MVSGSGSGNGSGSGSEGAQMSGYLRKKQKNGAKWKRLWFVLKDGLLYAFKAPEDTMPSDTFPILGYKLEILSEVRFFFSLGFDHELRQEVLRVCFCCPASPF